MRPYQPHVWMACGTKGCPRGNGVGYIGGPIQPARGGQLLASQLNPPLRKDDDGHLRMMTREAHDEAHRRGTA